MRTKLAILAAVAAAALTALALDASPAAAAPCQTTAALSMNALSYRLCTVPDLDQLRAPMEPFIAGLPNNGSMYCVPTSAVNWMAYIAAHGYPSLAPYTGPWGPEADPLQPKYQQATDAIEHMGTLMGTSPTGGTGAGTKPGIDTWFAGNGLAGSFVVDHYWASGGYTPRFSDGAMLAMEGRLVSVGVGWYDTWPEVYVGYMRDGGHQMSMAEARIQFGPNGISQEIGVRDPGSDDGSLDSQSTFVTDEYDVVEELGTFDGHVRVHDRIVGLGTNAFVDGFVTIKPLDALIADQATIKLINPWQLVGDDIVPQVALKTFQAHGKVIDVAFRPGGVKHPYLVEGGDAIWQLDVLTGESTRLAPVPNARRLVVGGPEMTLFALQANALVALDRNGRELARAALRETLADIGYDERRERLAGVTASGDALVLFDRDLKPAGRIALPARPCAGRLTLAYDPATGAYWLMCDGSPVLRKIDPDTAGVSEVTLEGAARPTGLGVDDRGRLLVSEGDTLVHYDGHGRRVRERGFTGMPGGSFVEVRRAFDNFDPATMTGPRYRNVLPEDA